MRDRTRWGRTLTTILLIGILAGSGLLAALAEGSRISAAEQLETADPLVEPQGVDFGIVGPIVPKDPVIPDPSDDEGSGFWIMSTGSICVTVWMLMIITPSRALAFHLVDSTTRPLTRLSQTPMAMSPLALISASR